MNGAAGHIEFMDIPATTWLGLPIYSREERVASLYLADKQPGPEFTDGDERVGVVLAAHASSIIAGEQRCEVARQAKADIEALLDMSPVAISVFDARLGEVSYMNRESQRMLLALTPPDGDPSSIFQSLKFTRPNGSELSFADLPGTRVLQSGETVIGEEIVVHPPDGPPLTSLVNCIPIFSESGEIVSVLTVSQDMTRFGGLERKHAEFLERVSEELRTPLISIKGAAAALKSDIEAINPTEEIQLLRIIDQQSDLMRDQVNSLIELAQIETGSLSVALEPAELGGLVQRSCAEYLRDYSAIAIRSDISEGLATVLVDQQRISKVLHNFLRQAAMRSNRSSPVVVSATLAGIHASISVSVDGSSPGPRGAVPLVNSTQDPQLFRQTTQSHVMAADSSSRGEGLAMAFCRGVVEAHGGRVSAEIDDQEGSLTFTFTLPIIEEEKESPPRESREMSDAPSPVLPDETQILVSIEEPQLLSAVRQTLLDAGYDITSTSTLGEVAEITSLDAPDLVLLDIAGRREQALRALASASADMRVPVIVLCDRSDEEYVSQALNLGADGYIVKPFSPTELIARVKAALRRSSAGGVADGSRTYRSGDVRINFDERAVDLSGQWVQLTATEYKLLCELASSPGTVLTHAALLRRVWGPEYTGEQQLLRSYVKSLRQKLGDNARNPSYIFTVHGTGYRMARPDR